MYCALLTYDVIVSMKVNINININDDREGAFCSGMKNVKEGRYESSDLQLFFE